MWRQSGCLGSRTCVWSVSLHITVMCSCVHNLSINLADIKQLPTVAILSLTLPGPSAGVSGSLDSYCNLKPLCSGMGEVVLARTSLTLLPPSPRTVLSFSCFKVSQCINCHDWHCKSYIRFEAILNCCKICTVEFREFFGSEMGFDIWQVCLVKK